MKQQRVQIIRNNCNSRKVQYRYFVAQQLHTGARCVVKKRRIKYFSVFALREETKRYSSHLNCRTGTLFLIGWVPIKLPSEINYHQPPNPHPQPNFLYLQRYVTSCKKSPIFLFLCASRRYVFRAVNLKRQNFVMGKSLGSRVMSGIIFSLLSYQQETMVSDIIFLLITLC